MRPIVIAVVVFYLLSCVGSVSALTPEASPSATPSATENCSPFWSWCEQPGYQGRVARTYEPFATTDRLGEPSVLVGIAVFDTLENTSSAVPKIMESAREHFMLEREQFGKGPSQLLQVSVRAIGESTVAIGGPLTSFDGEQVNNFAAVAAQVGRLIIYGYKEDRFADSLSDIADLIEVVAGRASVNNDFVPTTKTTEADAKLRVLPELQEFPEGWAVINEWVFGFDNNAMP